MKNEIQNLENEIKHKIELIKANEDHRIQGVVFGLDFQEIKEKVSVLICKKSKYDFLLSRINARLAILKN